MGGTCKRWCRRFLQHCLESAADRAVRAGCGEQLRDPPVPLVVLETMGERTL